MQGRKRANGSLTKIEKPCSAIRVVTSYRSSKKVKKKIFFPFLLFENFSISFNSSHSRKILQQKQRKAFFFYAKGKKVGEGRETVFPSRFLYFFFFLKVFFCLHPQKFRDLSEVPKLGAQKLKRFYIIFYGKFIKFAIYICLAQEEASTNCAENESANGKGGGMS